MQQKATTYCCNLKLGEFYTSRLLKGFVPQGPHSRIDMMGGGGIQLFWCVKFWLEGIFVGSMDYTVIFFRLLKSAGILGVLSSGTILGI